MILTLRFLDQYMYRTRLETLYHSCLCLDVGNSSRVMLNKSADTCSYANFDKKRDI